MAQCSPKYAPARVQFNQSMKKLALLLTVNKILPSYSISCSFAIAVPACLWCE